MTHSLRTRPGRVQDATRRLGREPRHATMKRSHRSRRGGGLSGGDVGAGRWTCCWNGWVSLACLCVLLLTFQDNRLFDERQLRTLTVYEWLGLARRIFYFSIMPDTSGFQFSAGMKNPHASPDA